MSQTNLCNEDGTVQLPCTHGGNCEWKIDGAHTNEYCGKCFRSKPASAITAEPEAESTQPKYKVGDTLAFENHRAIGWNLTLHKIEKITPSGRMVCGGYTLNSDLSIRGADTWSSIYCIGKPTAEFMRKHRKERVIAQLKAIKLSDLPLEQLEQILKIAKGET